ncbi:MAG: phosphonopyruvate decarboxylase [Rhodospirillales bacterium]
MQARSSAPDWPAAIHRQLKAWGVRQVAHVPDAGHTRLLKLCGADKAMRVVTLTTEEEGVALLAGAWLGGARGALLMQSSGVGNCVNMLSLPRACRLPLLMMVTMRGECGEFNPWQVPMGQSTPEVLRLAGVTCFRAETPAEAGPTVAAAARMAFEGPGATAVLLAQKLIGVKTFGK